MDQGYMELRPVSALFWVIAMSISRITTIAAGSDEISLDDVHAEFDDWLGRYRIERD